MDAVLWRLLQTADSLFPTGAFSHSGGLEGLTGEGILRTADDAERGILELVKTSFARVDLPACGLAHRAAMREDAAALTEIDGVLESLKAPREVREASRSLGRRRLKIVTAVDAYRRLVDQDRSPGHQAVVTGMHLALEGASREEAMAAYLYGTAAGLVSSAMKLLPIGQTRAQELLSKIGAASVGIVREADAMALDELGAFTPLLDIAAMRHEVAAPRLFIS